METTAPASVLSLRQAAFFERHLAARPVTVDLELGRGQLALVEVEDEIDAVAFVDLCVGLTPATRGEVLFLGRDWRGGTDPGKIDPPRPGGAVGRAHGWPARLVFSP